MPVTMPDVPTVATVAALLLHVPPASVLLSGVVAPAQTVVAPVTVAGTALTVTTDVVLQPVVSVKVISVVPALRPVSTPDEAPIVATAGLLLVHDMPDGVGLVSTVVVPVQIAVVPAMADGSGFTVTDAVL